MGFSFMIPLRTARTFIIDQPEVLLIASIIVAAKLCFPLDGGPSPILHAEGREVRLVWKTWAEEMRDVTKALDQSLDKPNYDGCTASQITSMNLEDLDAYFAYIAGSIDKRSRRQFPLDDFNGSSNLPCR